MAIEFWLGDERAGHTHENLTQSALIQQLRPQFEHRSDTAFCVFNFSVGREIDLAVFRTDAIIVVELKDYAAPIVGGENGPWLLKGTNTRLNAGRSANPFQQVKDNRNALRDF